MTSAYGHPYEPRDAAKTASIARPVHDIVAANDVAFEVAQGAAGGTGDVLDAMGQEMLEGTSSAEVGAPSSTSPAAKFTAVVVLPTPPFWLAMAMMCAWASRLKSGMLNALQG